MAESTPPHIAAGQTQESASDILRPALVLWLIVEVLYGIAGLTEMMSYDPSGTRSPWGVYMLAFDVTRLLCLAITVRLIWSEPEVRRIFGKPSRRTLELLFVVAVASVLFFKVLHDWMGGSAGYGIYEGDFQGLQLGWIALQAVLVAPLFEELLFRGMLLHRFRQVMTPRLAIAVQAMMFAAMHSDSDRLLQHFVFGCVAGMLRVQAGALWPCLLLHALWNGMWLLRFNGYL